MVVEAEKGVAPGCDPDIESSILSDHISAVTKKMIGSRLTVGHLALNQVCVGSNPTSQITYKSRKVVLWNRSVLLVAQVRVMYRSSDRKLSAPTKSACTIVRNCIP